MKDRERLPMLVAILFLGWGLWLWVRDARTRYWVESDGSQATAAVTGEGSHGTVYYRYTIGDQTFTGHGHPDWKNPPYANVRPGATCPVYYSQSHPWLSALHRNYPVLYGIPWAVIVGGMILLLTAVAVWPMRRRTPF